MDHFINRLDQLRSMRSELNAKLSTIEMLIRRTQDEIGELSIKNYFTKYPQLEPLAFGDKVLDTRGLYASDNVWVIHSVENENFTLRLLDSNRCLIMGANYEWLLEMRRAYLASETSTDNSHSQG